MKILSSTSNHLQSERQNAMLSFEYNCASSTSSFVNNKINTADANKNPAPKTGIKLLCYHSRLDYWIATASGRWHTLHYHLTVSVSYVKDGQRSVISLHVSAYNEIHLLKFLASWRPRNFQIQLFIDIYIYII
jgi:hypothetical protein